MTYGGNLWTKRQCCEAQRQMSDLVQETHSGYVAICSDKYGGIQVYTLIW